MSVKSMCKANARQSAKNKARYDRYRANSTAEKNQMRRLMRHLRHNDIAWKPGDPSYLIVVDNKRDPKGTIAAAWKSCVDKTGAAYARNLMNGG